MKLAALLAGHPHDLLQGDADTDVTGIATDSRQVRPGFLFVAVPGRRVDGHAHLEQAVEQGAIAALVSTTAHPLPSALTIARVDSTPVAASLAASRLHGEPGRRMRVVSITGTNGKTSTAAMLESVIAALSTAPVGVIGTGGPRVDGIPVPLKTTTPTTPQAVELQPILRYMADQGAGTVVMEASSLALWQHRLDHAFTDIGVFTNLSPDHLDDHGTMDAYKAAKLLLFSGMSSDAVVNADDPVSQEILERMPRATTFGMDKTADFTARAFEVSATGTRFLLVNDGQEYPAHLPIPGRFNVANALAAVAVCHRLGYETKAALHALETLPQIPGRMETLRRADGTSIVVDYAHSADSLEKTLRTLREVSSGRLLTVFGCGGDRDASKRVPMGSLAGHLSDHVVITSDNPRTEDPETIINAVERGVRTTDTPYDRITDRRAAIARALSLAEPGDTVLVAGKGAETYQLIGEAALPFEDMAVVRELTDTAA
ncbi:UDP-N-acetylmuramoyl-L-alanyl-D-glutamate--2,6-diaminopimelate ligase [Streptomyces sp. NPDC060243]|uniref:UDP-N-acetylmuramoyl-L-alanyl-D-glutamate--2, 6-diaminopimelate ligase n=1 Tax=Streptomyces sp. NPDC060243 TaxID=3347081 RepID=UPI003667197E